jgi:hypothetical protein
MRLPTKWGRTERTTVSTSGSSGIDENISLFHFDGEPAQA